MLNRIIIGLTACFSLVYMACEGPGTVEETVNTSISGRVLVKPILEPLSGVNITTDPPTDSVITGTDGKFILVNGVKPDTLYNIIAIKSGFKEAKVSVTTTEGENTISEIIIDPDETIQAPETNLNFGSKDIEKILTVENNSLYSMDYTIYKEDLSWITTKPEREGTIAANSTEVITLTADRSELNEGEDYHGVMIIQPKIGDVIRITVEIEQGIELCNGEDDDYDGLIDEDVKNDCNGCADWEGKNLGDFCDGADADFCKKGTYTCKMDGSGKLMCANDIEHFVEICDGDDNDCDGSIDEGLAEKNCEKQMGVCKDKKMYCNGVDKWSDCNYGSDYMEDESSENNSCDGMDNDCDGTTDEGCNCSEEDQPRECGTDLGECNKGVQNCVNGKLTICIGENFVGITDEICDGLDNNCNGKTDEDVLNECGGCGELNHTPGDFCDGVDSDSCANGMWVCTEDKAGLECKNEELSNEEDCETEVDDDCDGSINEGCDCEGGLEIPCGSDEGSCEMGVQQCDGGKWTECMGGTGPVDELCDGEDNNCNGLVDENKIGQSLVEECYGTDDSTAWVGTCKKGTKLCINGSWTGCRDEKVPEAEICDEEDNDCNGKVDDGDNFNNKNEDCTVGVGECFREGKMVCNENKDSTICNAEIVTQETEICDNKDNDCDGDTDEDLGTTSCGVGECLVTIDNCKNGEEQTCAPETAKEEVCDSKDNDCDSLTDEELGDTTCGQGECKVTVNNCIDGEEQTCTPLPENNEICDLQDNDCDGDTDEELGNTTCGKGICEETVVNCINGMEQTCTPGTSVDETCDSLDNDCDGDTDEELGSTTCGQGECEVTVDNCINGEAQTCVEGTAVDETCDLKDNDCDGDTDEGLEDITCGVGECKVSVGSCVNGQAPNCVPNEKGTEVCDAKDNDCDGDTDEDLGTTPCGDGACKRTTNNCENGEINTCVPGEPVAEDCDNIDNDCDSKTDEAEDDGILTAQCYTGPENTVDFGICKWGLKTCGDGNWGECEGDVKPEDETCDNVDNNCDALTDNDLGTITCGIGACNHTIDKCKDGTTWSCDPDAGKGEEICDGVDNDCDGETDDGLSKPNTGVCYGRTINCDGVNGWDFSDIPTYQEIEYTCDGLDNNCDGEYDEDLSPVSGASCNKKGVCDDMNFKSCMGDEGWKCNYAVIETYEAEETKCDNLDNDCDGDTDEGLYNACGGCGVLTGTIDEECDGSDSDECIHGTYTCKDDKTDIECVNETRTYISEICDDTEDNDCDGTADEDECYYKLPKDTNVTKCYSNTVQIVCPNEGEAYYGQDGNYLRYAPSYTNNGDLTTTDNVTKLMWTRCTAGFSGEECPGDREDANDTRKTYSQASTYCENLTLAGHDDWRLPKMRELVSIFDFSELGNEYTNPEYFPNNLCNWNTRDYSNTDGRSTYWTIDEPSTSRRYAVDFCSGLVVQENTSTAKEFTRCVRGENTVPEPDLVDNEDGTITDNTTGLMWKKCVQGLSNSLCLDGDVVVTTLTTALTSCENEEFAGYTDWRLPDFHELFSITLSDIETFFPQKASADYTWTSTFRYYWNGKFGVNVVDAYMINNTATAAAYFHHAERKVHCVRN